MPGQKKLYFLCDQRRRCRNSKGCKRNGGNCRYTDDIYHAKNFSEWSDHDWRPIFTEEEDMNGAAATIGMTAALVIVVSALCCYFSKRL